MRYTSGQTVYVDQARSHDDPFQWTEPGAGGIADSPGSCGRLGTTTVQSGAEPQTPLTEPLNAGFGELAICLPKNVYAMLKSISFCGKKFFL